MSEFTQSLPGFLSYDSTQLSIRSLLLSVACVLFISYLLGILYVRFGTVHSNRRATADNFTVLALATMLIILVVKSSLALSLGLIGALSIVRFRTAIKEPEELTYLFLNIAIGIGFGANQGLVTTILCAVIMLVICTKSLIYKTRWHP